MALVFPALVHPWFPAGTGAGCASWLLTETLAWPRGRGIASRIARPGIESAERLGRHRWKIAFLGLAAILTYQGGRK
jgi:hypothetical protein